MEIPPIWKILGSIVLFGAVVFLGLTVPPTASEKLQMAHDQFQEQHPICKVLSGTADELIGRGGPSVLLNVECGRKKTSVSFRCGIFGCEELSSY